MVGENVTSVQKPPVKGREIGSGLTFVSGLAGLAGLNTLLGGSSPPGSRCPPRKVSWTGSSITLDGGRPIVEAASDSSSPHRSSSISSKSSMCPSRRPWRTEYTWRGTRRRREKTRSVIFFVTFGSRGRGGYVPHLHSRARESRPHRSQARWGREQGRAPSDQPRRSRDRTAIHAWTSGQP